jgi:hypothetical protein
MRENEFERKVQAQMDDLRIRPSNETWERVEKELWEKKKRRAAVLFFIMAGLLLLGYSGYTFLNKSSNQPVAQNEIKKSSAETSQPAINTPVTSTNKNPAVAETPGTTPNTHQPDQNRNANSSLIQENVNKNPVPAEQARQEKSRQLPAIIKPGKSERTTIVAGNAADRGKKEGSIPSRKENYPLIANASETAIDRNSPSQTEKKPLQQPADKKDDIISNGIVSSTTTTNNNKEQMPADSVAVIDSTVAKTGIIEPGSSVTEEPGSAIAKNKNKSSWKIGIEISGGFISSQNKVLGFSDGSGNKSLRDMIQSGYTGNPSNIGTGANAPRVIIPPSPVNAGKSLKIGLVAEKAISKRSSLSAGLRYTYADESLEVGAIRDTVVRSNSYSFSQNFFAAGEVRSAYASNATAPIKYTNRYHFLEIPLLYQTQLNKGKKMGILWNAGIAPGFLIGTNALVYDTAARGVYYKNDKAFKKFHFNMQTGLALQFGNNKKIQWSLGPVVSLDMTRLMKEDVFTEKRYFLYTGLTGRVFLNPRKK